MGGHRTSRPTDTRNPGALLRRLPAGQDAAEAFHRGPVTTEAALTLGQGGGQLLVDLTRKAVRLLAENAALVLAQIADDADIENLG